MRKIGSRRAWIAGSAVVVSTGAALAAAGSLDGTFGTGGVVHTNVGSNTSANDVAVQGDGKVLVGGRDRIGTPTDHWRIRRYAADGSVDTGFGSGGSVTLFGALSSDNLYDLDLDSSGRIVAVGHAAVAGKGNSWTRRAAVARFSPTGSLDGTFGSGGTTTLDIAGASWTEALAATHQPDGKIVVAGIAHFAVKSKGSTLDDPAIFVARTTSWGPLDTTFGTGGVSLNTVAPAGTRLHGPGSVALQSDGRIVVGCSENALVGPDTWTWTIVRFQGNGAVDTGFGTIHSGDDLQKLVVDESDRILGFGRRGTGNASDMVVTRYTAGGALDSSFGSGGTRIINLDGFDDAMGGAVQADGKIVLSAISGSTSGFAALTVRLDDVGSLDTTYGTGGVGTRLFSLLEGNALLALAPDGRAVIAGYTSNPWEWWVARYDAN